jgi:hypothetical protein
VDDTQAKRRPIDPWRVLIAWLAVLPACTLAVGWWLSRSAVPGDARNVGVAAPWAALIILVSLPERFTSIGRIWHRSAATTPAVILLLALTLPCWPHFNINVWPAMTLYAGLSSMVVAAYIAATYVSDWGWLRKVSDWTGLWASENLAVAPYLSVPWVKAARSWALAWAICIGALALSVWTSGGPWLLVTNGSLFATITVKAGLFGTHHRRRARHAAGATGVMAVAAVATYLLVFCGGEIARRSVGWIVGLLAVALTAEFAVAVAITHLPERSVAPGPGNDQAMN